MIRDLLRRLAVLFRGRRFDADLEEEMRAHLEMQAEDSEAAGMSPEAARLAARRRFGNATALGEASRDQWGWRWFEDFAADARYALRGLARNPGFTAVAMITLALGIGLNTAVFSVLYSTCLAPLDYAGPERLVDVSLLQPNGFTAGTSPLNLADWKARSRFFSGIAAHRIELYVNLTGHGQAEENHAWRLSADMLPLLGAQPIIGRGFTPEDDLDTGSRSALLSYAFWRTRYGADPSVTGRRINVNGQPYTIVGVMPPGFVFPPMMGCYSPALWLSLNLPPSLATARDTHALSVVARLADGVSLEQADAGMNAIARDLAAAYPEANAKFASARVLPLRDQHPNTVQFRSTLTMLFAAAAMVLLTACANIANLLVARASARAREFSIRWSLGVSRRRLVRQLLTENVLLAGLGAAAGVGLAFAALPLLRPLLEGRPRAEQIGLHPQVLLFAALAALATGVVSGLGPALSASAAARPARPRQRLWKTHLAVEVALALVLFSSAALLLESFRRAMRMELGYRPEHVLTVRVVLDKSRYGTGNRVEAFRRELLARAGALPGVLAAGTDSAPPLGIISQGTGFEVEGRPANETFFAGFSNISPDYFMALGTRLLKGRLPAPRDPEPAVVVSDSFARRFLAGEDALGRRIRLARLEEARWFTIVGVVEDMRHEGPEKTPQAHIYALAERLPEHAQGDRAARIVVLLLRTSGDPAGLARAARAMVTSIDKDQPVAQVATMGELIDSRLAARRTNTVLVTLFAGLAVALAAVGVFGLVSYATARRTSELALRMALGARRRSILRLLLADLALPAAIGLACGLAGAWGSSRLVESLLFDVSPSDPAILAAAVVLLLSALAAAALLAARRAISIDPMVALRVE
ncbi:MAG TPA: hypothetical protein DEH78_26730 [Solibacterales bacterium]|nr:hypothetical protein [Bryobacterales bacterium]